MEWITRLVRRLFPKKRAITIGHVWAKVWDLLDDLRPYAYLIDIYIEGEQIFALWSENGDLHRAYLTLDNNDDVVLGTPERVIQQFVTAPERAGSFRITRDKNGKLRWVAIACTAIVNRVGEIDSTALFDSFVENLREYGSPYLTVIHAGTGLRMGQADTVFRDGYALVMSGTFDEGGDNAELIEAAMRTIPQNPDLWGTSIGFYALEEPEIIRVAGIDIPVYRNGYLGELSLLLEADAASWFTGFNVNRELENRRMSKKLRETLAALGLPEESIDTFESRVDDINRSVPDRNLIARSGTPDANPMPPAPAATEQPAPNDSQPQVVEIDEEVMAAVVEAITEHIMANLEQRFNQQTATIQGFQQTVTELTQRLQAAETARQQAEQRNQELSAGDAERQQEWANNLPRRATQVVFRPREQRQAGDEVEDFAAIAARTLANRKNGAQPTTPLNRN